MTRRLVSAGAVVLGIVAIVLAVCSATVWRPSATATATLTSRPDQPYVLVEPGVLGLVDSDVTVSAHADGEPVTLAVGYSTDATSWLADDPYVSVTGLEDWTRLAATDVTERCTTGSETQAPTPSASPSETAGPDAQATPSATASQEPGTSAQGCVRLTASGADPAAADVWQLTASDTSQVSLSLDAADPDLVLLASTDGTGAAPQLTLTWPRSVSTPWLLPGIIVGGVLVCLGVFALLMDLQIRRADAQRRQRAAERAARLAQADTTATLGIPALSDPNRPLTRRERRERERAEAAGETWVDPRAVAPAPAVPRPDAPAADVVPALDAEDVARLRSERALEDSAALVLADRTDDAEEAGQGGEAAETEEPAATRQPGQATAADDEEDKR